MFQRRCIKLGEFLQLKLIAWLLVAICMVVIYLLSNMDYVKSWHLTGKTLELVEQSRSETETMTYDEEVGFYSSDEKESDMLALRKLAHVLEYCGLGFLCFNAFRSVSAAKPVLYALALSVSYALFDEMHQLFVAGRNGSIIDVAIDSIGVLLGILLMKSISKYIDKCVVDRGQYEQ